MSKISKNKSEKKQKLIKEEILQDDQKVFFCLNKELKEIDFYKNNTKLEKIIFETEFDKIYFEKNSDTAFIYTGNILEILNIFTKNDYSFIYRKTGNKINTCNILICFNNKTFETVCYNFQAKQFHEILVKKKGGCITTEYLSVLYIEETPIFYLKNGEIYAFESFSIYV